MEPELTKREIDEALEAALSLRPPGGAHDPLLDRAVATAATRKALTWAVEVLVQERYNDMHSDWVLAQRMIEMGITTWPQEPGAEEAIPNG